MNESIHLFWNIHLGTYYKLPVITFGLFLFWALVFFARLDDDDDNKTAPFNYNEELDKWNHPEWNCYVPGWEYFWKRSLHAIGWMIIPATFILLSRVEAAFWQRIYPYVPEPPKPTVLVDNQTKQFRLVEQVKDSIHPTVQLRDLSTGIVYAVYLGPVCPGIHRIETRHILPIVVTQTQSLDKQTFHTHFHNVRDVICIGNR